MRCRVGIATGMVIVGEPVGTSFLLEKRLKLSALPSYTFGPFRLDTEATILFRRGEPVALGPRAVGLLRVLVEQRGVPVSKDTLIERAWAGLAVEESNLPVQIAALRRVLGEKLELDAVASVMLGIAVPVDRRAQSVFANVLLAHFLNSLDALVGHFGSKPIRPERNRDRNPSG